jgi:hypothetical protein
LIDIAAAALGDVAGVALQGEDAEDQVAEVGQVVVGVADGQ